MMKKLAKKIFQCKWKIIMILFTLSFIFWGIYIGYMYYKTLKFMQRIENFNIQIRNIQKEISFLQRDEKIKKYILLKKIYNELQPTKWSYVMRKMYDIIQQINAISNGKFEISNFSINMEQLRFIGKVDNLVLVYSSGGLIDQFENLPFIKKLDIPYYRRINNMFEFSLNANIFINDYTTK